MYVNHYYMASIYNAWVIFFTVDENFFLNFLLSGNMRLFTTPWQRTNRQQTTDGPIPACISPLFSSELIVFTS